MLTRVFTLVQVPDKSLRPTDSLWRFVASKHTTKHWLSVRIADRCAKHCQSVECSCSCGVIENNVFCRCDFEQIIEFRIHNSVDGRCQRRSESHFQTQLSRA